MDTKITITDEDIVKRLEKYLRNTNGDEVARIAGMAFGGDCYYLGPDDFLDPDDYLGPEKKYEFTPNESYWGAFLGAFDNLT